MAKYKIRNIWSFYQNNLLKWFFIFRRTSLHALRFPIPLLKSNLWSYWKWLTEKYGHFSWRQKREICFPYNTFVFIFVNNKICFSKYIEMELKIFLITSWIIFRMEKLKHRLFSIKWTGSYYMQINNTYIICTK